MNFISDKVTGYNVFLSRKISTVIRDAEDYDLRITNERQAKRENSRGNVAGIGRNRVSRRQSGRKRKFVIKK